MPELKRHCGLPNNQMIHTLDQRMAKHELASDLETCFSVHNGICSPGLTAAVREGSEEDLCSSMSLNVTTVGLFGSS